MVANLASMGMHFMEGAKILGGPPAGREWAITVEKIHPEAFMFCTSASKATPYLRRVFGEYCVEISDAVAFFEQVTYALFKTYQPLECMLGRMTYNGRKFAADDGIPHEMFNGRVSNKEEYEVRMFWSVAPDSQETEIAPFQIEVPSVIPLCKRLS